MSTTKHTPGPWNVRKKGHPFAGDIFGPNTHGEGEQMVAQAFGYETTANRQLIAAAPDLLAALVWIMEHRASCDIPSPDGEWDELASAAIAKATGQ